MPTLPPEDPNEAEPRLRIGELSRRTGVRTDTLRAWERRYGLLEPTRSDGGFRLYDAADVARVSAMQALTSSGTSTAEAARLVRSGGGPPADTAPLPDGDLAAQLLAALVRFDDGAANAVLDRAVSTLTVEAVAARVVLPVLAEIGGRWERDEVSVGQEHFATSLIRGRLMGLARNWGAGTGPRAVLACPPGELHDLGLLVFGLLLHGRGWRIVFLGADAPIGTVADAAERTTARAVILTALRPEPFLEVAQDIAAMARSHRVWLAGAGASDEIAARLDSLLLGGDPIAAAARLAAPSVGAGGGLDET